MATTDQRCAQCGTRIPLHRRACPVCVAKRRRPDASIASQSADADDAALDPRSVLADVRVPEHFPTERGRSRLVWLHLGNALAVAVAGVFIALLVAQLKRDGKTPWLSIAVVCATVAFVVWRAILFARARTLKLPAIVVQKREHEAATFDDDRTRYFATLWFADGSTREYETNLGLHAGLARASVGVALLRLDQMLDFAVTGSVPLSKVRQRFPFVREPRRPWWKLWRSRAEA